MKLTAPEQDLPLPPLVLIVAPDWETGRILRARLSMQGFDVFIALSITDAMELLEIHLCDIVIVDTGYFGPAAMAFFHHLRARSAEVCLVAMGAAQSDGLAIDAELPAYPDAAALRQTLASLLSRRLTLAVG